MPPVNALLMVVLLQFDEHSINNSIEDTDTINCDTVCLLALCVYVLYVCAMAAIVTIPRFATAADTDRDQTRIPQVWTESTSGCSAGLATTLSNL